MHIEHKFDRSERFFIKHVCLHLQTQKVAQMVCFDGTGMTFEMCL